MVCDGHGRITSGEQGLYVYNTRFLSALDLTIGGDEPRFVSANAVDAHAMILYLIAASPAGARAGPAAAQPDGGEIAHRAIAVQIDRLLDGGLRQDVHVSNHGLVATSLELIFRFAADFADRAEVRKGTRSQTAPMQTTWSVDDRATLLRFDYLHPRLQHGMIVRVSGAGERHPEGTDRLRLVVAVPPQQTRTIAIEILPRFRGALISAPDSGFADAAPASGAARADTILASPVTLVQAAWSRAASDLDSLALGEGAEAERRVPASGIPAYQALFGRDTLVAGAQAMLLSPDFLRGALRLMARWQGKKDDPAHDEEPGKLLHQHQLSPLALLGENPFLAYYGDYTAPASFVIGVALDLAATADIDFARSMLPHVEAVLDWMERYGDADGDGFYEYDTRAKGGLKNQGWKDSGEAVLYPDGQIVANPIALATIQARYYAAKQLGATVFAWLGDARRGETLRREAADLKRRFNEKFWLSEERYFALALDAEKRPVATIASDAGQCLAFGIVDADKAAAVAARLMAPDLFSGWGMRTLSSAHPAYNPFGYHLGTVWPWSTALIAYGLRRYGFESEAATIVRSLLEATQLFVADRLPEAIGGYPRDALHPHPGIYPESNAPQAWSAAAIVFLIETMLGIVRLAPLRRLLIDPALPEWLPSLTLRDLRFGAERIALRFTRNAAGETEHEVITAPDDLVIERPRRRGARGVDAWAGLLRGFA